MGKAYDNALLALLAVTSFPLHKQEERLLKADANRLKKEFAPLLKKVLNPSPVLNLAEVQQALTGNRFGIENGLMRLN